MKSFNKAVPVSSTIAVAAFSLLNFLAAPTNAQYVFFDRFDSDPVGTFPSTWTSVTAPTYGQMSVTNNLNAPSTPNAFQINNVSNEAFRADRVFPTVSLNTVSQVVIGFSIRVDFLTNFNSAGAYIRLNNTSQGFETFGLVRILSLDTSGATWAMFNDFYAGNGGNPYPTNGLLAGAWYDFRWEIDPSPTNAQTGVIRWYLNNTLFNTETSFTTPDAPRTNFNDLVVVDLVSPVMKFSIDNVYMFEEIPEPSSLGLALLAMVGLCGCRNLRRRS